MQKFSLLILINRKASSLAVLIAEMLQVPKPQVQVQVQVPDPQVQVQVQVQVL